MAWHHRVYRYQKSAAALPGGMDELALRPAVGLEDIALSQLRGMQEEQHFSLLDSLVELYLV